MKKPITLILLLPMLLLSFAYFGDNWGYAFGLMAIASVLLEIRIKKGNLSWRSISEFFNTPMNPRGETEKEMLARNHLRYEFSLLGLVVCLVWLFGGLYFGFQIYETYKDWNLPVGIDTILFVVYMLGLGVLYRVFFIKQNSDKR